jgi:ubiquinone/menaquinone biosynthesis C-methylase UbiE
MSSPSTTGQPTPERFLNMVSAFQQTEAVKAAIQLDIFSAIAEGNTTASAIGNRSKAAERGVRILCDYLAVHGLLNKTDERYSLAPDAAMFLDRCSPAYMGSIVDFLTGEEQVDGFRRLTDAVRKGGSAKPETPFEPDDPMWVLFAQAMKPLMYMLAQGVAQELRKGGEVHKVLDIAAGHGIFGISVAQQNPQAQIYAADWPKVLEVATQNAKALRVGERYHTIPGSAFETQFGDGYDLVLITNFLHHFDVATNVAFLRKVHVALGTGGRVGILEFVPNPDRITPPTAAGFSLVMLANTPSGDAYTFDELKSMLEESGFSRAEQTTAQVGVESLVVAYK